jgi:hypothetical protein
VRTPGNPSATASLAALGSLGDLSGTDRDNFLKVARAYSFWHFQIDALDYVGSDFLDAHGYALREGKGWTIGFYVEPGSNVPTGYAALQVDGRHKVSELDPAVVQYKGAYPLTLVGCLSPAQSIARAIQNGLALGDRYSVRYVAGDQIHAQLALVSAFANNQVLKQTALDSWSGQAQEFEFKGVPAR